MAGIGLLLGVFAWEIGSAPTPVGERLMIAALVAAAAAAAPLALRWRLAHRLDPPVLVLLQGVISIGLATAVLSAFGMALRNPMPLTVIVMLAVLLTINPETKPWVLASLAVAVLAGLAVVWSRTGLVTSDGVSSLLLADSLVSALALLTYANWSLTERHSRAQAERLHTISDTARRVGSATTSSDVAGAVLSACREAYPQATWGGLLVTDQERRYLSPLPVFLGPDGIATSKDPGMRIAPGEGITGSVFATDRAMLLRTRREIIEAYADTAAIKVAELTSVGGGRSALAFIAAPLRSSDDQVIGVLVLNSHLRERAWDTDDLTVVQAVADHAAVALERARLYERYEARAATDSLTGLANRRVFDDALAAHRGQACAVLAIDVDRLKATNDEFGHAAGDVLLRGVANALSAQARLGDLVARVGGDEFVAVLRRADDQAALAAAERLRTSVRALSLPHGSARVSIGLAAGQRGCKLRTLWNAADEALAAAKHGGRDRVISGTAARRQASRLREDADDVLDRIFALSLPIVPRFQPIVRLSGGAVLGHEALARIPALRTHHWRVDELFAAAQRLGRSRDLDWLCRRRALESGQLLPQDRLLFINVSVVALLDPVHTVDQMLLLATAVHREPTKIVLEISERNAIADKPRLRSVVASYRKQGFRFAVADVGDMQATLELLETAAPEYVKLGRRVTASMSRAGSRAAVRAVVEFAKASGACVVAEGVEDGETARRVASVGIQLGQGYFYGHPASAKAAAA